MNKIKLNFYRFMEPIAVPIDVTQGKNEITKIINRLKDIKEEADLAKTSASNILSSLKSLDSGRSLKKMRNDIRNNIKGALQEVEKYIKDGNASDKFVIKVRAEADKFSALEKSTDFRTASKMSDVNKLSGIQNRLATAMSTEASSKQLADQKATVQVMKEIEQIQKQRQQTLAQEEQERQKNIAVLRKQFEEEEKVRLAQEKINSAVKNENNLRRNNNNLFTELKGGISGLSQGILSISQGSKSFLKHLTGAAVTFRILGGAVSGVMNTFKNLYDTAASYEEAVNLYRTALGKYAKEADAWAERISTALHLDPKDVMQYTGALYNLVQGLGVGEDAAYKMATNLTQLSYDMSSYLNIDVESAYEKVQSAITGQARAVARAGVALQVASLQELAYSMGIKKSVSEMSQAEKTYLRYIQLIRSTSNMQQDLGKTILTPENALRVVRAEFVQFARALGQVVIPIVIKVIPYLTALANMLKEVAKDLAATLGFKMTEIDYSHYDTANDKLSSLNNKVKDTGSSASKTKKELQRMLAPFDELNVVESESASGGGGSGSGAGVLGKLKEYVTGYDMLGKLTGDFDKQVDEARKNLEKMIPVIKTIAKIFAAWKVTEKVASLGNLISKFKIGIKEGKGFGGIIKTLASRFSEGFRYAKALGGKGLGAVQYGIKNMLGPLGTAVGLVGTFATAAFGSAKMTSDWNGEMDTLLGELVGPAGLTTALAVIGGVALGPLGVLAGVVGGVAGALLGLEKAYQRVREEEEYQKAYDTLFDGQGISLNKLRGELEKTFKPMEDYYNNMKPFADASINARDSVDKAKEAIQQLHETLEYNDYEENKNHIGEIKTAYDTLKDAVIDADKKEQDRQIAQLTRLYKEGRISKREYDERVKEIKNLTSLRAAQAKGYYQELADLDAKLATGKITQAEYNKEVEKLSSDYRLVAEHGNSLQLNMTSMYDVANKGFDLENPESMKTALEKLMTQYGNLKSNVEEVYNTNHDLNVKQLEDYDLQLAMMERQGIKTKDQQNEYDALRIARENLYQTDLALTDQYNHDMEVHGATYKDVMLTMLAQIDAAGLTSNKNVEDVVDTIKNNLNNLKNYDASQSTAGIFKSFAENFERDGGEWSREATIIFKNYASEIKDQFDLKLSDGIQEVIDKSRLALQPQIKSEFKSIGGDAANGLADGLTSPTAEKYVKENAAELGNYSIAGAKLALDSHSPSKEFMKIGNDVVEGLKLGIENSTPSAVGSITRLANSLESAFSSKKLTIDVNTNVENSFNAILSKLQKFCNNWTNAVNKLMKNTKATMNGISIDKDGKISYTAMPDIKVSKFAKGGFPTSGDLFFANENGMPEYITSIGNRSAVANQDQMVSALSGAILTAMSKIPTNTQPSNIAVYVGDKKLYEGQGEYQNRQNDRYGTTVVRI